MDRSSRLCDDYQKHSEIIRKDAQPMPRIIKTTDASARSKWFTKLDLASGYWMVVVDERGHEKTALTRSGIGKLFVSSTPYDSPIDPKGSISTTLATPGLDQGNALRQEEAFVTLKKLLTDVIVLSHLDFTRPFTLDVVVSDKSMGAALSQAADEGELRVIAYEVSADHARKRYCVTRKELLALVHGDWNSWMSISSMSPITPSIRSRVENRQKLTGDLLKYCQVAKYSGAYGSKQLKMVKTSNIGAASASSHGISTLSKLIVCPNASTESETLCAMLAAVLIDRPDDWDMYLDQILQAYRFSVHHTTGMITYGWEMRLQVELINGLPEMRQRNKRELRRQKMWKEQKTQGKLYQHGKELWI
ncbi:RNA-directed DNA polymerase -like protein [Trichinella papuae]|uniref:RNA-directed DNA polymerase-like protein n=1 Tax=Trichinella papuae TaxID=268474 RepID=A0A0V1M9J5_9BILA|nr:RNA-directed DNA polymerase -like protein [Trichinella papuae]